MEKQLNSSLPRRPSEKEDLVNCFTNEIQKLSLKKLSLKLGQLSYLAENFDPYQGVYNGLDISVELLNILNEFKLNEYTKNPFEFTNILLQLLDLTQEEAKKRSH